MYYDVFSCEDDAGQRVGVMIRPDCELSPVFEIGANLAYCGCVAVDDEPHLVTLDPIAD